MDEHEHEHGTFERLSHWFHTLLGGTEGSGGMHAIEKVLEHEAPLVSPFLGPGLNLGMAGFHERAALEAEARGDDYAARDAHGEAQLDTFQMVPLVGPAFGIARGINDTLSLLSGGRLPTLGHRWANATATSPQQDAAADELAERRGTDLGRLGTDINAPGDLANDTHGPTYNPTMDALGVPGYTSEPNDLPGPLDLRQTATRPSSTTGTREREVLNQVVTANPGARPELVLSGQMPDALRNP